MRYSQLCKESCRQNHVDKNPCERRMRSSCHLFPVKRVFNDRTFTLNYSPLHFSCNWGSTEMKECANLKGSSCHFEITDTRDTWVFLLKDVVPSFSDGTLHFGQISDKNVGHFAETFLSKFTATNISTRIRLKQHLKMVGFLHSQGFTNSPARKKNTNSIKLSRFLN